jgi:hypothetical protein
LASNAFKPILFESTFCVYDLSRYHWQSFVLGGKICNSNAERQGKRRIKKYIYINLKGDGLFIRLSSICDHDFLMKKEAERLI